MEVSGEPLWLRPGAGDVLHPHPAIAACNRLQCWSLLERNGDKMIQRKDRFLQSLVFLEINDIETQSAGLLAADASAMTPVLWSAEVSRNPLRKGYGVMAVPEHVFLSRICWSKLTLPTHDDPIASESHHGTRRHGVRRNHRMCVGSTGAAAPVSKPSTRSANSMMSS